MACGKQILSYLDGRWQVYPDQPTASVGLFFPLDSNTFFVASHTKYQESDLYFGKGQHWKKIRNPLANTISSMYFTDSVNGVIAGLGEIALLRNNRWQWLPPPVPSAINSIFIDRDSVIRALVQTGELFKYDGKWSRIKGNEKIKCFRYYRNAVYVLGDDYFGVISPGDSIIRLSTNKKLKKITCFFMTGNREMFAVGKKGLILHFKDGVWKTMESDVNVNLNAIWMTGNSNGWVVGNNGMLLHLTTAHAVTEKIHPWKGFKVNTMISIRVKVIDDEYGVVAADFNNDGLTDIFTCGLFEANHLYINSGNNTFADKAQQWNVNGEISIKHHELNLGACAGDFDNDGDEDLYVTVLNGRNKLYKNYRGKSFVDYSSISHGTGEQSDRTNAVIAGDVDNDGDLDIFITNENTTNRLFLNNGAGIFEEVTQSAGLTTKAGGMGCSFADIDNDGDLDLYVANWSSGNILYKNLLKEKGKLFFEDITAVSGTGGKVYTKSNAVVFADIDNDADPDLFVTNRKTSNRLYLNDGHGLFTDRTADMPGEDSLKSYGAVIADFDGDGWKDIYVSNVGTNVLFMNVRGKRFVNSSSKFGAGLEGYSTGSAAADFDNNGSIDLYVANYVGESSAILINNENRPQYIRLKIEGIENNLDGVGTKIYVFKDGKLNHTSALLYYEEVSGGSGYASMNQRFLPIAVGGQSFVDVRVVFPSGAEKIIKHIRKGNSVTVKDLDGLAKIRRQASRQFTLLFKDPHELMQLLAWIIVMSMIILSVLRGAKRYRWHLLFSVSYVILLTLLFYLQSDYFEFKNILLSTILPVLSVAVAIVLVHLYFERNRIRSLAVVEQEQMREKLSRDLHDDLASTVSSVGIYLTLIRYNLKNKGGKLNELLDKTTSLIGDAASSITDLIWAISPRSETLDDLITRVNNNFSTLFGEKGIAFSTISFINTLNPQDSY